MTSVSHILVLDLSYNVITDKGASILSCRSFDNVLDIKIRCLTHYRNSRSDDACLLEHARYGQDVFVVETWREAFAFPEGAAENLIACIAVCIAVQLHPFPKVSGPLFGFPEMRLAREMIYHNGILQHVGIADELNPDGFGQDDGVGFWGRANANGPGLGVLVRELGAGYSFTAYRGAKSERNKETPDERYLSDEEWCSMDVWQRAIPGDLMKIFWNRNESRGSDSGAIIGCDDDKTADQEAGHSVIYMGCVGDTVTYWSSNGPGKHPELMGYSMGRCHKCDIQRVVFTRIMRPERFDNARKMAPTDVNAYLNDLNGKRHSTTAEMLRQLGL